MQSVRSTSLRYSRVEATSGLKTYIHSRVIADSWRPTESEAPKGRENVAGVLLVHLQESQFPARLQCEGDPAGGGERFDPRQRLGEPSGHLATQSLF